MGIFEIKGPDGQTYQVEAPDMQSAVSAFQSMGSGGNYDALAAQALEQRNTPSGGGLDPEQLAMRAADMKRRTQLQQRQAEIGGELTLEQRQAIAIARARRAIAEAEKGETRTLGKSAGYVDQTMSGVNEGIAGTLGAPVDLMTGALNWGARGINALAGTDLQPITNPVGGSGTFRDMMGTAISDAPPDGMGQRFARRIGQEAGAGLVPALGLAGRAQKAGGAVTQALNGLSSGAQSNLGRFAASEAIGTAGAGAGAAVAQEMAPGSSTAEIIGQMLGGGASVAGMYAATPAPRAPTLDTLKARQGAAYDVVNASPAQVTPQAATRLHGAVNARAASDGMDPFLAPKADRTRAIIEGLISPKLSEVEKMRRLVGRDVAGALDPTERAIGMGMKDEITAFLDNLTPQDVTGANPAPVVSALTEGRDMTRRIKKSEDIGQRVYRAENRAATSGTGGNEVNAIRQNVRAILDDPRKRRSYSPTEIEAMEGIVRGTFTQNALRLLGRFSPTAGALPAMGGLAGGASFGPLGILPSVIGYGAKAGAEALTHRAVKGLDDAIRNGGALPGKQISPATRSAIAALLAGGIAGQTGAQ